MNLDKKIRSRLRQYIKAAGLSRGPAPPVLQGLSGWNYSQLSDWYNYIIIIIIILFAQMQSIKTQQ